MIRRAFRMSVNPDQHDEYRRRHNPIWDELRAVLEEHGVGTYSIFIDPASGDLFAYAEIESEARWAEIAGTEVCQRWWQYMSDIMPANADRSPVSRDLIEVFHTEPA